MIILDILITVGVAFVGACCWTAGYHAGKLVGRNGHK